MKLVYSNLYKHSQYQSKISPNNYYVANAVDDRLVIRRQDRHLQVLQVHETRSPIDYIQWAPNSEHILTVNYQKSRVYIRSLTDPKWQGSIVERRFPIVRVRWSPDSKSIEFSPDGNYVAIVELIEGKEYISIYHANSFILLQRFEVDTADLENLVWSFDSMFIAVWDNCIY
ncbi:WD repeat-containing protein wrap73, partial [Rhizopus stolonifer]